jgi:hypothetical protein
MEVSQRPLPLVEAALYFFPQLLILRVQCGYSREREWVELLFRGHACRLATVFSAEQVLRVFRR